MSWLNKLFPPKIKSSTSRRSNSMPEGLWSKCPSCEAVLYASDLDSNAQVCPQCAYHNRIGARARINLLLDSEGQSEIASEVLPVDSLKFKDSKRYPDRLMAANKSSNESESIVVVQGAMHSMPVVLSVFEFEFMGGSMGSVLGERFVRGVEAALDLQQSFICITASGGARMQEGLYSLMQMAKTTAALAHLAKRKLPFISVLTDPTMGGVSASFAFVGDVVIAEPGALIGFAGPRVIEQTVRQTLPNGFQRAEFLLEKGAIDFICDRRKMRDKIAQCLSLLGDKPAIQALQPTTLSQR